MKIIKKFMQDIDQRWGNRITKVYIKIVVCYIISVIGWTGGKIGEAFDNLALQLCFVIPQLLVTVIGISYLVILGIMMRRKAKEL